MMDPKPPDVTACPWCADEGNADGPPIIFGVRADGKPWLDRAGHQHLVLQHGLDMKLAIREQGEPD